MVVIPAAVMGPQRTMAYYQEWTDVLIRPGLGEGDDQSRAKELIGATSTDSQSFEILIHNTLHMAQALQTGDPPRNRGLYFWLTWERLKRAPQPAPATRLAHWLLGGLLTGLTLLASGWRRPSRYGTLLGLGGLILLMPLLSPVCHLHYFCLALPLVMGLLWIDWSNPAFEETGSRIGFGLAVLLGIHFIGNTLPRLPELELLRDLGMAAYACMLLWLVAVVVLWRRTRIQQGHAGPLPAEPGRVAA
jgi:hypothetical protein